MDTSSQGYQGTRFRYIPSCYSYLGRFVLAGADSSVCGAGQIATVHQDLVNDCAISLQGRVTQSFQAAA